MIALAKGEEHAVLGAYPFNRSYNSRLWLGPGLLVFPESALGWREEVRGQFLAGDNLGPS